MHDRRRDARNKMIDGGVAKIDESNANIEFGHGVRLPKEISLPIARKSRSFLTNIIWWRDNFVGVAFRSETLTTLPASDLEARIRKSEKKKRQLQRRIEKLLGEG
jgi:hypothetical protein